MSGITKGEDGVYRWAYEFSLYRNPVILFTILKIFGALLAIGFALMLAAVFKEYVQGYSDMGDVLDTVRVAGIFVLFFLGLVLAGYFLYAAMQGGVYCVLFEMDEEGVVHRQFDKQVKKAQVVSLINVLAGIAGRSPTQVGIGLTSARSQMSSTFASVKSIKGMRRFETIKVNEPLGKNQVYVDKDDYDFVYDYIVEHCPQARVK